MVEKKPVYLLSGRRPRSSGVLDPIIQSVFRGSGVLSPKIAYIGVASGDNPDFFNRMAMVFMEEGACQVKHALISPEEADIKKAQGVIEFSDIVFISGGDVDRGMRILKEKNMVVFLSELYKKGKLFFGTSAGAIMLVKEWVRWRDPEDNSSVELFPCLGFVPVICDVHDEDSGWQELKTALRLEVDNTIGYGLVTGAAMRVSPEGGVEALGGIIHRYIRRCAKIDRISDILQTVEDNILL